jgi:predicted membrane chloride channel (bestrophin family)
MLATMAEKSPGARMVQWLANYLDQQRADGRAPSQRLIVMSGVD